MAPGDAALHFKALIRVRHNFPPGPPLQALDLLGEVVRRWEVEVLPIQLFWRAFQQSAFFASAEPQQFLWISLIRHQWQWVRMRVNASLRGHLFRSVPTHRQCRAAESPRAPKARRAIETRASVSMQWAAEKSPQGTGKGQGAPHHQT